MVSDNNNNFAGVIGSSGHGSSFEVLDSCDVLLIIGSYLPLRLFPYLSNHLSIFMDSILIFSSFSLLLRMFKQRSHFRFKRQFPGHPNRYQSSYDWKMEERYRWVVWKYLRNLEFTLPTYQSLQRDLAKQI